MALSTYLFVWGKVLRNLLLILIYDVVRFLHSLQVGKDELEYDSDTLIDMKTKGTMTCLKREDGKVHSYPLDRSKGL